MSVYTIKKEYQDIMENPNYINFETGEFTEEWIEALQENEDDLKSKCENIASYMENLEWENLAYKSAIDRITKLKKTNDNKVKSLSKILEYALNGQDLATDLFKFSYRKSEKAEILDKALLPQQFITTEMVEKIAWLPDIKKYLKEEIQVRIEEAKNDNKDYNEEDIKLEVYSEYWVDIKFNNNLQIK